MSPDRKMPGSKIKKPVKALKRKIKYWTVQHASMISAVTPWPFGGIW